MKKKAILLLSVIVFGLGLTSYLVFNNNSKEDNKVSNTNNVKKILKMPHNIQAYTLNGERTDKTFDEMVNYYVVDTITCQNGSVATYNQSDNTVTMTNVHVPEYCVMNFKPGTYTLTIDPNGGYRASDNDSSIMKVNYQYGHVESISERKKDGYTLIGYEMFNTDTGSADDVKGSKFEFDSSTNIGTFTQGAANITLKATWGTDTYKVTLDNQGATTAGTAEVYYQYNTTNTINGVTCYYYTDVTLKTCVTNGTTITVPTKTGYTFGGYYSGTNGTGTQYVDSKGVFMNNIYKTTGSKTLYAKWTVNKYKLTLTKGTGIGTIFYKINGASAYTSATATTTLDVNYNSTYYFYGVATTGYTYTKCTESSPCSAKIGAEAASQTLTGTVSKYKLTLKKGTGIGTIYYKINGASTYTSTTATATLNVNYGSTYYYYGVAATGYTYTACTASSPCSAKMGTTAVTQTLTGTINTYKVTLAVVGGKGATSKNINHNGSGSFTSVSPSTNYTATGATVSCNGGASASLSGTTVTVSKVLKAQTCTVTFVFTGTIYQKLLIDNPTIKTRTFTSAYSTDNTGTLYQATETVNVTGANSSAKTVYYFAGNAKNNWVRFGGYYWRIIRTNHDSSIRLLYAGSSTTATNAYIGTGRFNSAANNSMYVGYMYGTTGSLAHNRNNSNSSIAKGELGTWYSNNLKNNFASFISKDAVYCNDRTVGSGTYSPTGNAFKFAAYTRLDVANGGASPKPSYNCTNQYDAFSGNNTLASLTNPLGMMTADEIIMAGGKLGNKNAAYYYRNAKTGTPTTGTSDTAKSFSSTGANEWYTMTPSFWGTTSSSSTKLARMFAVQGSTSPGQIHEEYSALDGLGGGGVVVRPVISINSSLKWIAGNGSPSSPYQMNLGTGTIIFHRNHSASDTTTVSQTFTLGRVGNRFGYNNNGTPKWTQSGQFGQWDYSGYTLVGWALTQDATDANYSIYSNVSDNWLGNIINKRYSSQTTAGKLDIYAVWKKNS